MSIRRKQMLIMMATSSVVLLLACAAFSLYEVIAFRDSMEQDLATLADMVEHNTTAALDFNDPKSAGETLSALQADPDIIGAWLYTKDGQDFAKYDRPDDGIVFKPPAVLLHGTIFKGQRLILCRPIVIKGEILGTLYMESDMQTLDSRLIRYVWIVGLVFLVSWIIAFVLSNWLQRLVSNPILHLAQVARMVAQDKNYSLRATKQSNDELGQLVDGFNEMLAQIQMRDAALQSARVELEARVVERTAELAQTNEDLHAENADRKRAEQTLRESEEKFRQLADNISDVFWMTSPDFKTIHYISPGYETIWGRSTASLYANPHQWVEAILSEERERAFAAFAPIMKNEPEMSVEYRIARPDGAIRWIHDRGFQVRDAAGQLVRLAGIASDVTGRKRAEELLAYERDLLRTLLDNSPDQIYFKDARSRFLKSSKAQAENFGVKEAADLIGRTDFDFFAETYARATFEDEQEIIRTGQPMIGKIEKEVWPDGRTTWVIANKMPLRNKEGEIIGTFGLSKDITAIKQAEAKLEQVHRQLLETSRQAGMAEVATNVLHNVGNVLNSVNVSASLVADAVKKSKAASLAQVVALLREHARDLGTFFTSDAKGKQLPAYLSRLSEQLLADQATAIRELDSLLKNIGHIKDIVTTQQSYARVSGVKEVINLREVVEDSLSMNAGALGRHGVEIIREFEDVPPVNLDRHKVLQVLVNLIRNAKHACQDSERADKRLTVRVANGHGWIKISVMDNGVGILPENLLRIFNHGFTTRKDGHGFGLHSGALAAKEMRGSLNAQSDGIGQGATFTLELPCNPDEAAHE